MLITIKKNSSKEEVEKLLVKLKKTSKKSNFKKFIGKPIIDSKLNAVDYQRSLRNE